MSLLSRSWFIVAAKRTPVGTFGGALRDTTVTELALHSSQAAINYANIDPSSIKTVVFGNIGQSDKDTPYLARHVGLKSGMNFDVSAFNVNRLCGSGFQAIISCLQEMDAYNHDLGLAGGSENMSRIPHVVRNIRFGTRMDLQYSLDDSLMETLTDNYIGYGMALTAENIAQDMKISREDTDSYAFYSQECWEQAHNSGIFNDEIAPIQVKDKRGKPTEFNTDEHPRKTPLENFAKLRPVFKKDGVCTAGNSSGICDGSASIILASEEALTKYKLQPLARIVAHSATGCDPSRMGLGPVPAIQKILKAMKIELKNINNEFDQIEINEAFAAQVIGCERQLGIDRNKLNINGGGISIGHPVGFSGARIIAHLAHQIHNKKINKALGSACIGGGQGICIALQSV